jgi:3-deoxy-D-manno-octulosonate 8-phosphate phosphatase (KDO 8-P phosphatase)
VSLPQWKLLARARTVKAMVLDVDGVLTDAGLFYGPRGEGLKVFSARDGFAVKLAQSEGIQVAILSGRLAAPVKARLADLGIPTELVIQGSRDKKADISKLAGRLGIGLDEIAYMGDDIPDLPALACVGLAACPADAADEARERSQFVSASPGGHGAVRDLVRLLLQARGRWGQIIEAWADGTAAGPFFRSTRKGASDGK